MYASIRSIMGKSIMKSPPSSPAGEDIKRRRKRPPAQKFDMNMAILISPVKREQMRKREKAEMKKKMRDNLPVYTMEEIRRYRMPLYEAITTELKEQHLLSASAFFKQLIDYQEWMRNSNGPESKVWAKPRIIDRKDILLNLSEGLKAAEKAHYHNDFAAEIDQFLHLSVTYAFGSDDWWWLGEQLMIQSNELAKAYEGDGHRRYAIAEYIYGKFLYENLQDKEQAMTHLRHARILSMGHSWTAAKYLLCIQKTVFVESCIVLYKVLLDDAKDIMQEDAREAIKLCIKARRRAYDACVHDGEAKSLLLQGNCHLLIDEVNEAAQCFYKVLSMQTKAKKKEESCEARIWLIRAYLKLGHWEESYNHLQKLLQFALENNLPYYIGQAYRYLGEYYLNHGNPNLATPLLVKAIEAFHEIGDVDNREQVKNFAAVSAGQELMPKYIKYIVKSGEKSRQAWQYLQKLVDWKDLRKDVWSESDIILSKQVSYASTLRSGMALGSYLFGEEEGMYYEEVVTDFSDVQDQLGVSYKSSTVTNISSEISNKSSVITNKSSVITNKSSAITNKSSTGTTKTGTSKSVTIKLDKETMDT